MYAETREIINAPVEIVYPFIRDQMPIIVPYIPNVDKIVELERENLPNNEIRILNHWYAKAEVPGFVKSFIKPEFFQWKDHALWKNDKRCVDFRIESFVAKTLYELSGTNSFVAYGADKTEMKITFNLEIHPERLPGVPGFVAKKIKSGVEEMVKKLLTPNLTSLAKGLNKYYSEQKK